MSDAAGAKQASHASEHTRVPPYPPNTHARGTHVEHGAVHLVVHLAVLDVFLAVSRRELEIVMGVVSLLASSSIRTLPSLLSSKYQAHAAEATPMVPMSVMNVVVQK